MPEIEAETETTASARLVAEQIKQYVEQSDGDEISVRVIERMISDGLGRGWQPCAITPSHDGVEALLLFVPTRDSMPRRAYYKNGWRDERGGLIENLSPDTYWLEVPPVPERKLAGIEELRKAFIVDAFAREVESP